MEWVFPPHVEEWSGDLGPFRPTDHYMRVPPSNDSIINAAHIQWRLNSRLRFSRNICSPVVVCFSLFCVSDPPLPCRCHSQGWSCQNQARTSGTRTHTHPKQGNGSKVMEKVEGTRTGFGYKTLGGKTFYSALSSFFFFSSLCSSKANWLLAAGEGTVQQVAHFQNPKGNQARLKAPVL